MEVKDVRKLPWKKLEDWSELSDISIDKENIDRFLTIIFQDISRKLDCPYEELLPLLEAENVAFYSFKEQMSAHYSLCYSKELVELENLLRIPDTDFVTETTADNCLKLFDSLSDTEKIAFLQKIGKINVKVEYATE